MDSNVTMVLLYPIAGSVMACAIVLGVLMRMRPTVQVTKVSTLIGLVAKDIRDIQDQDIQDQNILDLNGLDGLDQNRLDMGLDQNGLDGLDQSGLDMDLNGLDGLDLDLDLELTTSNVSMVISYPVPMSAISIAIVLGVLMRMRPIAEITKVSTLVGMVAKDIRDIQDQNGLDGLDLDQNGLDMDLNGLGLELTTSNVSMVISYPVPMSVISIAIVLGVLMRMRPIAEITKGSTLIGMAAKDMWIHIQEQNILDLGMML